MLCLSQTSGYAILAMSCLDISGKRRVLAREVAARSGVPSPYLSKLLHALGRARLIQAKRGYRGGFVFARPPQRISLLDVVEAVEGRRWLPRCLLGLAECSDARSCPTHRFWTVERERIRSILAQLNLAEVVAFEKRRRTPLTGRKRPARGRRGTDRTAKPAPRTTQRGRQSISGRRPS